MQRLIAAAIVIALFSSLVFVLAEQMSQLDQFTRCPYDVFDNIEGVDDAQQKFYRSTNLPIFINVELEKDRFPVTAYKTLVATYAQVDDIAVPILVKRTTYNNYQKQPIKLFLTDIGGCKIYAEKW